MLIRLNAELFISAQVVVEVCADSSLLYVLVYIVLTIALLLRIAGFVTLCF
jgi:hypothetical protein